MRRHGHSPALAIVALASGGRLGILIPPSLILVIYAIYLVIYAIYTEQSFGQVFVAAIVPGLLAVAGDVLVVNLNARLAP